MGVRVTCAALCAAVAAALAAPADGPNYVRIDLHALQGEKTVDDLRPDEIELVEDGDRQTIDALELVRPRARVFVVFVDTFHLADASPAMRQQVARLIDTVAGDDDLVGLMHPGMSASDLALGRKGPVIEELLDEGWTWGESAREGSMDRAEQQWFYCYGSGERLAEMRARRREKMTLDALDELVARLRLRPERKAVVLVTEGWQLYGVNRRLAGLRTGQAVPAQPAQASSYDCDAARIELALMNHASRLTDATGSANRAMVTFYPVHPPRPAAARGDQLRELASRTDGLAALDGNGLDAVTRRIVADMTSYYLLGYRSTNARFDGGFRSIAVRAKRPGVQVRVRRGYRALTREEAEVVRAASGASSGAAVPASTAVSGILHRPDEMVNPVNLASLRHVVLWKRGPATGREYVASDDPRLRRTDRLRLEHATTADGAASARMLDASGRSMAVPVQVGERPDPSGNYRWVTADVALAPLAPGEYSIELTIGELKVNTHFQVVP